ncbi:PREDICTED: uncharacterized protein LOC105366895 isoform X2 [Ceratosolen solmsi marchali]|nr:PREDICTED: uncharacterized protein LOC105366895 isoform X2 [Ceratosolen solmsi marchali]XP_011503797.1 PREDICTED: uncharacterized protein LOC105366895 isoform X2 [Ceratosolen solmsi marchali]
MQPWKNIKNSDSLIEETDENTTDSEDQKNIVESDICSITADESSLKSEKSVNSNVSINSNKSRKSRSSRGVSPGNTARQKVSVDIKNPVYREPFNYGWKRELVYRAGTSENQTRRMADIYYYTPEGKKVRSYREVIEFLTTSKLTIDNFTFFKEPLGVNDPNKEIIRDAKKSRDSFGNKSMIKLGKKSVETLPIKRISPKKVDKLSSPVSIKTSPKVIKTSASFKVKLPTKKNSFKKDIKSPPTTIEHEITSPLKWSLPTSKRSQQTLEKSPPMKTKRLTKTKVQEPCSIRCSTSMGLIPSLQCSVCLCLYHPECTENNEVVRNNEFICKNCQLETNDSLKNQSNLVLTPPPLIPISVLSTPNSKSIHQTGLLPKLQRIPKLDSSYPLQSVVSKTPKSMKTHILSKVSEKKEGSWCVQTENEFLHKREVTPFKPAQNIALMGGKRYIVVPKNNTMAVQPTITLRQDNKIGDKPPLIQDGYETSSMSTAIEMLNLPLNTKIDIENMYRNNTNDISYLQVATRKSVEIDLEKSICRNSITKLHKLFPSTNSILSISNTNISETNTELCTLLENSFVTVSPPDKKCTSSRQNNPIKLLIPAENKRKKQLQPETDQRQYFMVSVCAGYDALSRIFQYLKVQELLRAARVCRMWRDLAAHPSLWKTVRMKNSQVTDWTGLAETLKNRGTEHLDLRKMLIVGEADIIWKQFITIIPRVTSLLKLELCRCPAVVVEEVMRNCPQLEVLSAMSIKCDSLNLEAMNNLSHCSELRLKAISGMALQGDLTPLLNLSKITHLSLTSVKDLGKKKIEILQSLRDLETLELGECSDFPDKFGTGVLIKLQNLERLRLEKGQGSCCTFDILEGISKLENLTQLELVNFDVKNGFDKCLANCKKIKRLLIIPTYVSQSATSNNMILGGVTELSNNLTHFVWGVTQELLRVTELFVDQCNQMNKQITGDSIPVLKPVPCLKLIEDIVGEKDNQKDDKQQPNISNPQVEILPLPHLQKLLLTALPKTRVKILKIPFHATWRQSISDSTSQ